jgi:hypothetical protein
VGAVRTSGSELLGEQDLGGSLDAPKEWKDRTVENVNEALEKNRTIKYLNCECMWGQAVVYAYLILPKPCSYKAIQRQT